MKNLKTLKVVLQLATVLLFGTAALAATNWSVQGVIDWSPFNYGPAETKHRIYDDKWDQAGQTLSTHAAKDGFIFLPDDKDFGEEVIFGTLAGAGGLILDKPIDPPYIDFYRVWLWVDVNANGQADSGDKLGGKPQNWKMLFIEEGPPGNYDTESGEADIGNLLRAGAEQIQAGAFYLLLLEVKGRVPSGETSEYGDDATSLEFSGGVTKEAGDKIKVEYTNKVSSSGWSATASPDKYFTKEGTPLDASGNVTSRANGVDDFEILWIRINNPPRGPRH